MKLNAVTKRIGLAAATLFLGILSAGLASTTALATSGAPGTPPAIPYDLASQYPQPQPVLHATFMDVDGGTGRVLYTIMAPGGFPVVTDAKGEQVPSGSDSVYKVPLGLLQNGVTYKWTARSFDGRFFSASTTDPNLVAISVSSQPEFRLSSNSTLVTATTTANPWGCVDKALSPHNSSWDPGYIKAEAQTNCTVAPQGVVIEHLQYLYRSSWSGWRFVGENVSYCDSGTYSAGQPFPQCNSYYTYKRMQAYVWWPCVAAGFQNQWYNYKQEDYSSINQSGTIYYASDIYQTGAWDQPGIVPCN